MRAWQKCKRAVAMDVEETLRTRTAVVCYNLQKKTEFAKRRIWSWGDVLAQIHLAIPNAKKQYSTV